MEGIEGRACARCGQIQPESEFYKIMSRGKPRLYSYCRTCASAKTRAWRVQNPERAAAWFEAHRDDRLAQRRERRAARPEATLRESLRHLHRLDLEEFRVMDAAQSGRCAICGDLPSTGRLHIDHAHATGRIRGLLCGSCNKALGLFRDDPDRMRAAVRYLGIIELAEAIGL